MHRDGVGDCMRQSIVILSVFLFFAFLRPACAAEGGEGKPASDSNAPHSEFQYVELDPLTLPVITNKGVTQQVSVMVQLEVEWGKRDEIASFEPRLIDAYLQ